MTKEEKAKAYDEALEKARRIKNGEDNWRYSDLVEIGSALTEIFPQLAESEDERIRKGLIEALKTSKTIGELKFTLPEPTREECIAYLEKQNDVPSRETTLGIWKLGNFWKENQVERDGLTQLQYIQKYLCLGLKNATIDYLKEQKPVEKEITLTSFEGTLNTFLFDFANSPIEDCEPKEYIKKHSAEILKAAYKELNAKLQQDIFEARQEGIRDGYEVAKAEQKPAEIAPNQFDGITYGMQGYSTEKPAEWSEEDESKRWNIISIIGQSKSVQADAMMDWLKSLRPSWKPSEVQMEALQRAIDACESEWAYQDDELRSLLNDLKKL